jgi:hypothetical protein
MRIEFDKKKKSKNKDGIEKKIQLIKRWEK